MPDTVRRAGAMLTKLHHRTLALARSDQDADWGLVMQALALVLEMQLELSREQGRVSHKLDH